MILVYCDYEILMLGKYQSHTNELKYNLKHCTKSTDLR